MRERSAPLARPKYDSVDPHVSIDLSYGREASVLPIEVQLWDPVPARHPTSTPRSVASGEVEAHADMSAPVSQVEHCESRRVEYDELGPKLDAPITAWTCPPIVLSERIGSARSTTICQSVPIGREAFLKTGSEKTHGGGTSDGEKCID